MVWIDNFFFRFWTNLHFDRNKVTTNFGALDLFYGICVWQVCRFFPWEQKFLAGESLENLFILYSISSAFRRFCGLMFVSWTGSFDCSFSLNSSRLFGLKQITRVSWLASCIVKSKYLDELGFAGVFKGDTRCVYPSTLVLFTAFSGETDVILRDDLSKMIWDLRKLTLLLFLLKYRTPFVAD